MSHSRIADVPCMHAIVLTKNKPNHWMINQKACSKAQPSMWRTPRCTKDALNTSASIWRKAMTFTKTKSTTFADSCKLCQATDHPLQPSIKTHFHADAYGDGRAQRAYRAEHRIETRTFRMTIRVSMNLLVDSLESNCQVAQSVS